MKGKINVGVKKVETNDKKAVYTVTRKITLYPVGDKEEVDRVYKYLRDGMESQNKAMNQYISALYVASMLEISDKEDKKELNKLYTRISSSSKGSAYCDDIEFAKGLPSTSSLGQKVRQDFSNQMKKGLGYGRVSLCMYKADNPLLVHVDYVRLRKTNPHTDNGLYHEYENDEDAIKGIMNDAEPKLFIKFANGIIFKVVLGHNLKNSMELRSVFVNIIREHYKVQGSSIGISKKKIILNMSIQMPKTELILDKDKVCGVDLGVAIPAVCAINDDKYSRLSIGCADDFLRERTKMQSQKRRMQKNVKNCKGGHGRKRKLQALDRIGKHEKQWAKSYNHYVSKQIVDFAAKHGCGQINMEHLAGFSGSEFILRNWSYFELQQFVTYKANKFGIKVKKIDPYHTSQVCSECGHWEEGQRVSQKDFICKNPECKNFGKPVNADFNAARNISMSTEYVK